MNRSACRRTLSWIVIFLVGSIAGCSHSGGTEIASVATWRDGKISAEEYHRWLAFRGQDQNEVDTIIACEELLLVTILAAEVKEQGIDDTTARQIDDATDSLLAKQLRRSMAAEVEISDEEIDVAYAKFPKAFHQPQKHRLRNIFLRFPPAATEKDKDGIRHHMAELLQQLEQGADFATVAQQESDSQTRFQGGLLGNVAPGQLPEPVNSIAMALNREEISAVIESSDGLTIIKCDSLIDARTPTPDEVRAGLAKNLRRIREKENWETLMVKLANGDEADNKAFKRAAAQRAKNLGLDRDFGTASAIAWTRRQHLATEALRRRVEKSFIPPPEADVRAFFEENRAAYLTPETFDLSVITIEIGDDIRSAQSQAFEISYRLRLGTADFAQAAKNHSVDPSSSEGGSLPSMTRRQLAGRGPEFMKTVTSLKPGEISREFMANGSMWIVRLDSRHLAQPAAFEQVADQVRKKLTQEWVAALQDSIEEEIMTGLEVVALP